MQVTWLSEMSPAIRHYRRGAAAYEAYLSHKIPAYATMKDSQRALTDMLHNAIVMVQPVSEIRDYVPSHSVNEKSTLPPRLHPLSA